MTALDDRAGIIYRFLRSHLNQPYRLYDLCAELRMQPSARTRTAIDRARRLAEADDLHLPHAVPANGHTYCVTDDPCSAVDPAIHLVRAQAGYAVPIRYEQEFAASRRRALPLADRELMDAFAADQELQRLQGQVRQRMLRAVVAQRREFRKKA